MRKFFLSALLILSWASIASAQLVAAKEGPIVYGHHHLNTTSVEAQKKFFVDALGGTLIKVGTNNTEIVQFNNVLIFLRLVKAPPGGTKGTTANHIGFSVPNLRAMVDKVKSSGYQMITSTEATPDRKVIDDIAGPPPAGGSSIAFVMGPDDVKVELVEARQQTIPITLHHVHFFHPNNTEMQAWYVKTFGATSRLGGAFPAAILPGVALNFSASPTPVVGTQGRALDHIGFEVRNLEAFTKKLEAEGIKLAVPYRQVPALGIAIAFFTDPWGTYIELTEGLDKVGQTPAPAQVDGGGGARATAQQRPPDSRRPRGTAVGLLGWKAGIRSDAFGPIPFAEAAAKIDAAGVAFVEGVSSNLDYKIAGEELVTIKSRLAELGLRIPAYRIESLPSDQTARLKLVDFAKALDIELILTRQPADLPGVNVAVEDTRGVYKQGTVTLGANLHDAAKAAPFLLELSKQQPPERPDWPNKCTDCATSRPSVKSMFFTIDPGAAENYDKAVRVAQGYRVNAISRMLPITTSDRIPPDERQKVDAAVPRQPVVKPRQARKLLIIDVCPAGGFYHTSIAHGNLMLELIGKYTGAYEPIFDNNLDNLKYPRIKQYDAVFLNSVVGPVFSDPEVLDGLIRYVREGGGVAGLHGVTFASQDVREFGELMGAQEGPHQYNGEPGTLKIDDPNSPLAKHFGGKGFSMIDEFYHFPPTGPYSREKLHVLLSVDADKTDLRKWQHIRPDNDYGMVWIKTVGKGRVFNSVLGHRPEFYMMPDLVKLMLGGIQFVLGDLEADTTPSAKSAQARQ